MNRRRILTKYQLGNLIFLGAAFFFGMVFSTYISQIFKIYYVWYAGIEKWSFFIGGLLVLSMGLSVIGSIFVARKLIFDTIFIYITTIVLFLSYWSLFFISARPKYGIFLFLVVSIVIGLLISLMTYIWKRNGGAIVWIFFVCGIVFAGLIRVLSPVTTVSTLYLIRFSFISIALVVLAYLLGFIGMFKGRKTYVVPAVLIMFLSILYPLNLETVINSRCSYKKELSDFACVSKYETDKRTVDVMFGKYADKNDSFMFVENKMINRFTYPSDETSKLFFYTLLLQQPNPKNIILSGDAPLGVFEVYRSVNAVQEITLLPFDINDALSKARLANPAIYSGVKIIELKDDIAGKFDQAVVFLPAFNTINLASLLNDTIIKSVQDSEIIYVGTNNNIDVLIGPVRSWLKSKFKKVEVLKSDSLIAVMASNNETMLSISPDVLKLRYLDMKISFDYTKIRAFIETIKPYTEHENKSAALSASNIAFINDYLFPGTYKGARAFAYMALLFILIYSAKYMFMVRKNKTMLFYYSDLAFTSIIASSFFVIAILYYQFNWGEIYSRLPVAISLFIIGIIFAALIYYYLGIEKIYSYYLILAAAIVLQVNMSWMMLMRKIEFSMYVWLYILLFGLSTVFSLSNVIVKPKDALDVKRVLYISGLMLSGIGIGIILTTMLIVPLMGLDYSSYLLFLCSFISLIFHALIIRRNQEPSA